MPKTGLCQSLRLCIDNDDDVCVKKLVKELTLRERTNLTGESTD